MVTDTLDAHVRTDPSSGEPIPVPLTPVRDTWQRLARATVPVHALIGGIDSDDHIRMAQRAATAVRRGRSVTIDGTAHYPNMERPAEFNDALLRFLDGAAPER